MSTALTCGLVGCRVLVGANGATIVKCDTWKPNVIQLKEELTVGWRVKARSYKRQPAATIDRSLDPIPERDLSQALVYQPLDPKGTQRDLVTGPEDGVTSFVNDVLVVNHGGHEDKHLAANSGRLAIPFGNWTDSHVWKRLPPAHRSVASKRWMTDRVPVRPIR